LARVTRKSRAIGTFIELLAFLISMRPPFLCPLFLIVFLIAEAVHASPLVTEESLRAALVASATSLHGPGEAKLLAEARTHDFFLLGELHGENEVPALIKDLWPQLWNAGYRHVGAELSPWAADRLQFAKSSGINSNVSLWTPEQSQVVRQFAKPDQEVLWGCDIDEGQPQRLILDIAKLNPADTNLQQMVHISAMGYDRKQALELLNLSDTEHPLHDVMRGGISLWQSIRDTLHIEALRSDPTKKLVASESRELIMKQLFLSHYQQHPNGKVFLRFGRNHLHRGYDARGISTLGNFLAEWALAKNKSVVNVGVFAAGGQEHLAGETFDADERQDELTFALLGNIAGLNTSLFDLRPLRPMLHSIDSKQRTPLEENLIYWADSYDYLICYPVVSPLSVNTSK
jgi:hypothetical protein